MVILSGTLLSGSLLTKQPNQPSVIMQARKILKALTWHNLSQLSHFVFWKLKARCGMKCLWVKRHVTTRLSTYAWISNASLIYGIRISFLFIWINLKISILFIQERRFAKLLSKKISYFYAHFAHAENISFVSKIL